MAADVSADQLRATRRTALAIDVAAVAASLAANIAAAPPSIGGWLVAAVAPIGLFVAIVLWHRSHGVLKGWLAWSFNVGLAGIATGAAWISFGHLRAVAERFGQSPGAAAVIPLVIDGAAVLATIVVISAGKRAAELDEAEAAARELDRRAQAAEIERARQAELEVVARQERLGELRSSATNGVTSEATSGPTGPDSGNVPQPQKRSNTAQAIADYLAEHPEASRAEVAEAVGTSSRTVQRWVTAQIAEHLEADPGLSALDLASLVPGASVETVEASKPWRERSGAVEGSTVEAVAAAGR